MLPDRVLETIRRYDMFSSGQKVGLSVSGGADSVCLLHLAHELAPRWNLQLSVVHIEHGIRGATSQADARFVAELAKSFALPFHLLNADVPAIDDNLEQAARRVRLDFYRRLVESGDIDRIATAHTRSDQAETVLHRVLRGTGLTGLAGIRPVTAEGLVRPLLYCTRHEIRSWLEQRGIAWREDETNKHRTRTRNRIRHDLIPSLQRDYNPQIENALANLADIVLQLNDSSAFSGRISAESIRGSITAVKGDLREVEFRHIQAILNLARSNTGHGRVQIPGVDVVRSLDEVRFIPAGAPAHAPHEYVLPVYPPETLELPGGLGQIEFQLIDSKQAGGFRAACDSLLEELDWQLIATHALSATPGVLELRNWRPGDRYRRRGHTKEEKLKRMFQESRVPQWERGGWPVLTFQNKIVWCRNFGASADFAASSSSPTILRIQDRNQKGQ